MPATPRKIGVTTAYFQVTPEITERIRPARPDPERPLAELPHPWPQGANVEVVLPVWEQDGWLYVTNVSLNTLPLDVETPYGTLRAPIVERLPLSANIWRTIPLGALMEEAIDKARSGWFATQTLPDSPFPAIAERSNESRPGRATTDAHLHLAVEAYKANPTRGVVAAQDALQAAGARGSSPDGRVTREQAKKAIARARQLGLLEPGRRTRQENRS